MMTVMKISNNKIMTSMVSKITMSTLRADSTEKVQKKTMKSSKIHHRES
jgi:hypothetical protein